MIEAAAPTFEIAAIRLDRQRLVTRPRLSSGRGWEGGSGSVRMLAHRRDALMCTCALYANVEREEAKAVWQAVRHIFSTRSLSSCCVGVISMMRVRALLLYGTSFSILCGAHSFHMWCTLILSMLPVWCGIPESTKTTFSLSYSAPLFSLRISHFSFFSHPAPTNSLFSRAGHKYISRTHDETVTMQTLPIQTSYLRDFRGARGAPTALLADTCNRVSHHSTTSYAC